jgi:excisionase family DNA binding protein
MRTADTDRDWLTVEEVAHRLGCSTLTVRRRIRDGSLPYWQSGGPGTLVRIPVAALDAQHVDRRNQPDPGYQTRTRSRED